MPHRSGEGRSPQPEIQAFTGLRGVAAWAVVAYHIRIDLPFPAVLQTLFSHGEYAVDIFFVMSGYVLALSYGARFTKTAKVGDTLRFLGFRLARIYPAHAAVLVLYAAIPLAILATGRSLPPGRFEPGYLAASVFLVQNWGLFDTIGWNVPAWSISAELMFYLAFPLAALAVGQLRIVPVAARTPAIARTLVVLALVTGLAALAALGHIAGQLAADISRAGPLRCLLECTLGMILREAARLYHPNTSASLALTISALALAALFGSGFAPDYMVIPAAILCLLLSLVEPRNPAARFLAHPILLWLGRISFSTYIVHYLVKDVLKLLIVGHVPVFGAQALYFVTVLGVSAALHHGVERPGQRAGKRLTEAALARLSASFPTTLHPELPR